MHLTTMALVLREVSYKESDKILTVLSADEGRLTVSARGCRKKGSPIAAACQLLVWSEMTLYEYKGRWVMKEALPQRQFGGVRRDLDKLALGSYFAEVVEALCEEGQSEPELLSLILNSLHALDAMNVPLRQVKTAFEWRAMALAGYEPMADACAVCGRQTPEDPRIHLGEGVLHCAACRSGVGEGISMPLSGAAVGALRHILYGSPKRLFSFRIDEASLGQLADASEAYLMTRLERGFRTLDFYKSLSAAAPEG